MSLKFKKPLLFSLFVTIVFSCGKTGLNEPTEPVPAKTEKVIEFKGEQVKVASDFPVEFLNQSNDEFETYYRSLHQSGNLRIDADQSISYEELSSVIEPFAGKYPDLSIDKDISEKDIKRIFADFKSISSLTQIREKSEIIVTFYEALLKKDVLPEIIKYKKNKKKSGRISGIGDPFGFMNPHEESVAMNHPRYVPGYTIAASKAKDIGDKYADASEGKKGDAIRHSTWNCLIIRNVIILGASKNTGVRYAMECTTAHEKSPTGDYLYGHNIAMDLHNNLAARTWMESEIGWGVGWARDMPIESRIENTMRIRAGRARKFNTPNYLNEIVISDGVVNNWGVLYGAITKGGYGELVYYQD